MTFATGIFPWDVNYYGYCWVSLPRYFNFSFIISVTPSSMTRSNLNLEPHGVLTTRSEDDADEDRGSSEAAVTCGVEAGLGVGGAGDL